MLRFRGPPLNGAQYRGAKDDPPDKLDDLQDRHSTGGRLQSKERRNEDEKPAEQSERVDVVHHRTVVAYLEHVEKVNKSRIGVVDQFSDLEANNFTPY